MGHYPCDCCRQCRSQPGSNVLDPGVGINRVCIYVPQNPSQICCDAPGRCRCAGAFECEQLCAGCPCNLTLALTFVTRSGCNPIDESCDIAMTLEGGPMCMLYYDDAGTEHGLFCGWYFMPSGFSDWFSLPCLPQGGVCHLPFILWLEPGGIAKYHWGHNRFSDSTIETIPWSGCAPRTVILPVSGNICCCCSWGSAILTIPLCS
jgi:hypothetical protein